MSGKYKRQTNRNGKGWIFLGGIGLLAVILVAVILFSQQTEPSEPSQTLPAPTVSSDVELDMEEFTPVTLEYGLTITDLDKYAGVFMEDGSDEIVSGVLMMVVTNAGEQDIQYAEITLATDNGEAKFTLTTLPVGETCVLLEQNRLGYTGKEDASQAAVSNVAVFQAPLSLQEEKLQLQVLDGALNVVNISGEDITGDLTIYYKNAAAGVFYGGITYRIRIEGGIKAGEIKQIMANHFSDTGSKIVFVTLT